MFCSEGTHAGVREAAAAARELGFPLRQSDLQRQLRKGRIEKCDRVYGFLSLSQASALLCVDKSIVRQLLADGSIYGEQEDRPSGGFRWRIRLSDVLAVGEQWLERDDAANGGDWCRQEHVG